MQAIAERVLVTNRDEKKCRTCRQVHPYLSAMDQAGNCGTPAAFTRDDADRLTEGGHWGDIAPVPDGIATVPIG